MYIYSNTFTNIKLFYYEYFIIYKLFLYFNRSLIILICLSETKEKPIIFISGGLRLELSFKWKSAKRNQANTTTVQVSVQGVIHCVPRSYAALVRRIMIWSFQNILNPSTNWYGWLNKNVCRYDIYNTKLYKTIRDGKICRVIYSS